MAVMSVLEETAPRTAERGLDVNSPASVLSEGIVLPPALRPYQSDASKEILASALSERGLSFTVVMARQAGKNELSAQIELYLLGANHRRAVDGIKCAPTFEPQGRISMQRL